MFENHEAFRPPTNAKVSVWRYMDLAKFASMLEAQALHFARADIMEDVFEGSIGMASFKSRRESRGELMARVEDFTSISSQAAQQVRNHTYLNCWHMNEHESVAMWKIYPNGQQGIAVRSTYSQLVDSITDQRTIHVGEVSYNDFEAEIIPDADPYYPFVYKRINFDYEREIRAVYPTEYITLFDDDPLRFAWKAVGPAVVAIAVDLNILVDAVYVSPKAPGW